MPLSLESSERELSQDERQQLVRLISDVETIKSQMAQVAVILKQLSDGMVGQRAKAEPQFSELASVLEAMKIHVDSFPRALREARRSDLATQHALEKLAGRVSEIEAKMGINCSAIERSAEKS